MKRVTGIRFEEGRMIEVKNEIYECICIKDRDYTYPYEPTSYTTHPTTVNPTTGEIDLLSYDKDSKYEFYIDEDKRLVNPYSVYVGGNRSNSLTKEEFDNHFVEVSEYRNKRLNKLLDNDV